MKCRCWNVARDGHQLDCGQRVAIGFPLVRCGARMARGDTCDRYKGHKPGHRSRYAMDNEIQAKRRQRAA